MKKSHSILIILIITMLSASCSKDRKASILENNAEKINKKCPVRIDSLIILDSTRYNKIQNSMTYNYSIYGSLNDSSLIQKNYNLIKNQLGEAIDNSVDMRKYKEFNVTIIYKYYSSTTKRELAEFVYPMKSEI